MLIEILSKYRLKITLDLSDIDDLEIYDKNNKELIIEKIKALLPLLGNTEAFVPEECDVSVRPADGGCTVFVTRHTEEERAVSHSVLLFDRVIDLVNASRHLSLCPVISSDLYGEHSGSEYLYYLTVYYEKPDGDFSLPLWLVSAYEFSKDSKYSSKGTFLSYLNEHCKLICRKNAVFVIANLKQP